MSSQIKVIPLTRWEREVVKRARNVGMAHFGDMKPRATFTNIARELAGLSDNERHWVFCELDGFVKLTEAIRGAN